MNAARKAAANASVSVAKGKGLNVEYTRDELNILLVIYFMIRDCVDGEPAIKGLIGSDAQQVTAGSGGSFNGGGNSGPLYNDIILSRARRYLPQPNAEDQSQQNRERYRAYVQRAVFYNVTARTLEGMCGQIFLRNPVVNIPSDLDILKTDADGGGLTLDQLAYRTVRHVMSYGRSGILVDYPVAQGSTTKKQILDGDIRPTLTVYNPWDIINWRIEYRGAKRVLSLVVLREPVTEEGDDGFELNMFEQYRVLKLDPLTGEHLVEIYQKDDQNSFELNDTFNPKDANGKALTDIPFHFVGSENNDIAPNRPPLYDLAALNIAHYRNSADYEEACFIAGQPTPVLTGLSEDWVNNVLNGAVTLGSRGSIALPVGASAHLLQAGQNGMPHEAMEQKEKQMVALGAKLVQIQKTQRTATQSIIETTSESSTLANVAKNVSAAFEWAITVAESYVNKTLLTKNSIKYQLNNDFDLTSMTADDQAALVKEWQAGAITFGEMRTGLRKAGVATLDDDTALALIIKEMAALTMAGVIADPLAPPAATGGPGGNAGGNGPTPAPAKGPTAPVVAPTKSPIRNPTAP